MCNFDSLKDILLVQLTDLDTFNRLIRQASLKQIMFKCVQTLMTAHRMVVSELQTNYCRSTSVYYLQNGAVTGAVRDACLEDHAGARREGDDRDKAGQDTSWRVVAAFVDQIDNGIRLGSFLCESGWLEDSLHVFNITLDMIQLLRASYMRYLIELNCIQK